ncbi:hypothetical protein LEP1GSC193_0792 [Leptospira phage vB_LalZ_80412-LE1]|nr:hypothetical protein LEP1GSC193_0792 [Leptospira phage vB_LalZ_80412-LE1]
MGSSSNSGFSFPNLFGTEIAVPGVVTTNDYSNGTLTETSIKNIHTTLTDLHEWCREFGFPYNYKYNSSFQ